MDPEKPGYLTTEFWLVLFTNIAALVAIISPGFDVSEWVQPAAVIAAALATLFYTQARGRVKAAGLQMRAAMAHAPQPRAARKSTPRKATARKR